MARFQPGQPRPAGAGRKRGTPNKVTVERAVGIEQAERAAGRKLAVDRLAEAMEYWFALAEQYEPKGKTPDLAEFRRCLKEGTTCARDLAPYQSARLQSTTLRQDMPQEPLQINVRFV